MSCLLGERFWRGLETVIFHFSFPIPFQNELRRLVSSSSR